MCCRCGDLLEFVIYAHEMLEGVRGVLLCMPDVVKGELYLLEVPEVMCCVLLCMLEAVYSNFPWGSFLVTYLQVLRQGRLLGVG